MLVQIITAVVKTSANYVFPVGRVAKLASDGYKITNSTNPIALTTNITLTVIDCCTPPPVRLAAHCVAAGATVVASAVSPNPLTIGCAAHLLAELYENC